MIERLKEFIKNNQKDLYLALLILLISLMSFSFGFLAGRYIQKEPLIFESPETQE